MQGSRQGFYKGAVYEAILDRVISVLKKDPALVQLQTDAEQKIAELKAGDEMVRKKLDELIEGHHEAGQHSLPGSGSKGSQAGMGTLQEAGRTEREVVVSAPPDVGEEAEEPVLLGEPAGEMIRIHPDEQREIVIKAFPAACWSNMEAREIRISPIIPTLKMAVVDREESTALQLIFTEPDDAQADDYPTNAKLTFTATFEGLTVPRQVERGIVITRKKPRPPTPPPALKADPTFLKVVSHQPVRLDPGGPLTHVRLRWDGEDYLASGWPPLWTFSARCISIESFPSPIFSRPRAGNFELLLDAPHGLLTGQQLEFEVEAAGPNNAKLVALFTGEVAEPAPPPEPRKKMGETPEGATKRKPPYELKFVTELQWDSPCWGSSKWTKDDAGSFEEPNGNTPLTLIVNNDAELLKSARDQMLARQLEQSTIEERLGRYTAHIYFHLFNMYQFLQAIKKQSEEAEGTHIPNDNELRAEINRVAITLASLMDR